MINVTLRIPSARIKYGYVEISGSPKEIAAADPVALAADYINFMGKFTESECQQDANNRDAVPIPVAVVHNADAPEEAAGTPDDMIKAAFPKTKVVSEAKANAPWEGDTAPPEVKPWEETKAPVAATPEAPRAIPTFDFS